MYNVIAKKKAMTERSNGTRFIKRDVRMVRGRYAAAREMHFISLERETAVALHGGRRYRQNEDRHLLSKTGGTVHIMRPGAALCSSLRALYFLTGGDNGCLTS